MAQLTEGKLKEELKKLKRRLYVIASEDIFKLNSVTESLVNSFSKEQGGSKQIFFADETMPENFLEKTRTGDLFQPRQILVLKMAEKYSAKQWEVLLPLLSGKGENLILIQINKVDSRLKFFQSLGKADCECALVKLERASRSECAHWISAFSAGFDWDMRARDLALDWSNEDLCQLRLLVEKVCLFAGEGKKISEEHIRAVGLNLGQEDVFQLSNSLLLGDRRKSLMALELLLNQGEEPLMIVGLLTRQYRWILEILALRAEGEGDASITRKAGLFPSAAKVLFPAAKVMGGKRTLKNIQFMSEIDKKLKSSRLNKKDIMVEMVVGLTRAYL